MSRGWEAVSKIGEGLLSRGARKRELDDERKYLAEQAQLEWDRDAEKRKAEEELRQARIAASKEAAAASRMNAEQTRMNIIGGKVVNNEIVSGEEMVDEEGRTTFIPKRTVRDRSLESQAADTRAAGRDAALRSDAEARREDVQAERARQERLGLEQERRGVVSKMNTAMGRAPARGQTAEERDASVRAMYKEQLDDIDSRLSSLQKPLMEQEVPTGAPSFGNLGGPPQSLLDDTSAKVTWQNPDGSVSVREPTTTQMGGNEKAKENQGKKRNPEFDAAVKAQKKENPTAGEAELKAFVESALGIKEYL
jgi:hypothetical protein